MKYEEIQVGTTQQLTHTITQADIEKFVDLSGDDNKLHVDKAFAARTSFKKPVVHGMIGASFISTVIGTKLPGDGAGRGSGPVRGAAIGGPDLSGGLRRQYRAEKRRCGHGVSLFYRYFPDRRYDSDPPGCGPCERCGPADGADAHWGDLRHCGRGCSHHPAHRNHLCGLQNHDLSRSDIRDG